MVPREQLFQILTFLSCGLWQYYLTVDYEDRFLPFWEWSYGENNDPSAFWWFKPDSWFDIFCKQFQYSNSVRKK